MNKQGYSVCFFPNDVPHGRSDSNCLGIRAWFVDIDYKDEIAPDLDTVMALSPLIPSYIVRSSLNGYHLYYLARSPLISDFTTIQKGLVNFFGGDPKCVNPARIMRRPGLYNMKKPDEPFLVTLEFESDARYYQEQMLRYFPYIEPDDEPMPTHAGASVDSDNIFDQIRHYDSRAILERLSGTQYVGFKKYRLVPKKAKAGVHYNIIVDGKDSGCFVNSKGNVIGSEGFRGGAVEWLVWYGFSRVDAMKAIKEVMGWD